MADAPSRAGRKHARDAASVPDGKIPATAPSGPFAFLSRERFQQLHGKREQMAHAAAALQALDRVEHHPSRSLLERLIADDEAWRSVHDEWKKLAENGAKWESLADQLDRDGADKVEHELRVSYGLTPGAAGTVVTLLIKLSPPQAKCIPCIDNGQGMFFVASLENWFGPFRYPRVLVDTGCTSFLLTLSTCAKGTIRPDDTVLQQLPLALPPATHTYTVGLGRCASGRAYTLMVGAKNASVQFPVRLAADNPRLAGATTYHLPFLRFHVSAYDAAAMLQWPCLSEFALAPRLDKHFADAAAVLRAAVESKAAQRTHVILGQSVLGQMGGLVLYQGDLLLIPRTAALPLDPILQRERDATRSEKARFQFAVVEKKGENIAHWDDEDHGAFVLTASDDESSGYYWQVHEDD